MRCEWMVLVVVVVGLRCSVVKEWERRRLERWNGIEEMEGWDEERKTRRCWWELCWGWGRVGEGDGGTEEADGRAFLREGTRKVEDRGVRRDKENGKVLLVMMVVGLWHDEGTEKRMERGKD